MKYGIYDIGANYWVKRNYKDSLADGITMTPNKSEALASESREFIENVFKSLVKEFEGGFPMMQDMMIKEL